MVFGTDDEGYNFYRQYARGKKHKNKAMSRVYACSRQGSGTFYKDGEDRKRAKMSNTTGNTRYADGQMPSA